MMVCTQNRKIMPMPVELVINEPVELENEFASSVSFVKSTFGVPGATQRLRATVQWNVKKKILFFLFSDQNGVESTEIILSVEPTDSKRTWKLTTTREEYMITATESLSDFDVFKFGSWCDQASGICQSDSYGQEVARHLRGIAGQPMSVQPDQLDFGNLRL